MGATIGRLLLSLITGDDEKSVQPAYFWGALAVTVGLCLEVWAVLCGHTFDMQQFAVGAGGLIMLVEGGKRIGQ